MAWGKTMARLHELSRSFHERPGFQRPEWWAFTIPGCRAADVALDPHISELRQRLLAWLRSMQPEPLHYAMVHGDFERTNFLIENDGIRLFDFDDCCRHRFVWDIACALWVFRDASFQERKRFLGWFLDGYATARQPDLMRLEALSDLIRLRSIAPLLHRCRNPLRFAGPADRAWVEHTREWLRSNWRW